MSCIWWNAFLLVHRTFVGVICDVEEKHEIIDKGKNPAGG